jgi:hypothetical protein
MYIYNMLSLILIDGEIRSLIRNSLERLIGYKFGSKKNKLKNILFTPLKLSVEQLKDLKII